MNSSMTEPVLLWDRIMYIFYLKCGQCVSMGLYNSGEYENLVYFQLNLFAASGVYTYQSQWRSAETRSGTNRCRRHDPALVSIFWSIEF